MQSDLLGAFTIPADSAIEFPRGLLGLEEHRRFALVRAGTDAVFWLQSLEEPGLVFLLVDPFVYFSDYSIDLPPQDVAELGAETAADVAVLAIVTLPAPGAGRPTANLQGPIAVNLRRRRAKQVVSAEADFGVRCEFDL